MDAVLRDCGEAGLDALAEVALDGETPVDAVLGALSAAGFDQLRLHVARPGPARERVDLWCRLAGLAGGCGASRASTRCPPCSSTFRPTTGYDDVKAVALARLALPGVAHLQVDWARYGPKLAQVALTFGANDVDGVSASDEAPLGRRRAPLEEIRRNIEAAGFEPVERTGRFAVSGRMTPLRVGAVGYLNARPLTWALDRDPGRWRVRYDLPAVCADLLRAGDVDLGPDAERGVPVRPRLPVRPRCRHRLRRAGGVGGAVRQGAAAARSGASRSTPARGRRWRSSAFSVAATSGSRRPSCDHGPDLRSDDRRPATRPCSSAIRRSRPTTRRWVCPKIDMGEAWREMTGLPFVYAAWTGRPGAVTRDDVEALAAGTGRGRGARPGDCGRVRPGRREPAGAGRPVSQG